MKVIFASFGSFGDINPFLWMAQILKDHGFETTIITNKYFEEYILEKNINCIGIGDIDEYKKVFNSIDISGKGGKNILILLKNLKNFIKEICIKPVKETFSIISEIKDQDTIIIHNLLAFGAGLAGIKNSLKRVTVLLAPITLSNFRKFNDNSPPFKKSLFKKINELSFKNIYGKHLEKIIDDLNIDISKKSKPNWIFNGKNICLFPPWFQHYDVEMSDKLNHIGFPEIGTPDELPADLTNFLEKNNNPIVFTPGTLFSNNDNFFNEALKTLKYLNKPGIFLSKSLKDLHLDIPDNVYIADFIPLDKLLDRCGLIVHHGGIGTTSQSLRSGAPQIIFYHQGMDQKINAEIIEKQGICRKYPYKKFSSKILNIFIKELLTDDIRDKCLELRDTINGESSADRLIKYVKQL